MDASKYRKSKWLKSTDIADGSMVVTVEHVGVERMRNSGDEEVIVKFRGLDKSLVLNGENHDALLDAFGSDSDDWLGKQVELFTKREPMARTGYAVRIRSVSGRTTAKKPVAAASDFDDDEDIPF
jgi:hypothetical protein